jgi:phage terminase small subunit
MDPLTALGLASNIVQFVDFTSKLISATHSLYESTSGAKSEHLELETLAKTLRSLADDAAPPSQGMTNFSTEDATLIDLGNRCRDVSDELLAVLQSLRVKGSHRGWKSFVQALRSEWKQKEISALEARLNRIGEILNNTFFKNLSLKVYQELQGLKKQNTRLQAARTHDIEILTSDIQARFNEMGQVLGEIHEQKSTTDSLKQLSLAAKQGRIYSAEQQILDLLQFEGMGARHTNIRPAHDKTFPWIFESSTSSASGHSSSRFVEWMVSEDNLYWISGKPGSGKSTLMKYVCNHDLTRMNLEKWASGSRLVIAKFFFWTASKKELPKSQEGLLRSVLYQMLRQCPDLIPQALPSQWHAYTSRGLAPPWTRDEDLQLSELLAAFERISSLIVTNNVKFCFFIDGLDEYSGKPNEIIPLIETFGSSPNIKTCVSSRPWNEFEKVYGQNRSRKLYMEKFNRPDIERYVRDTLEKDPTYQELQEMEDGTPDLVKDVVDSASGVFLWVYLVVQSLLDGLSNEDSISNLQRRLRRLPKDLKEFFKSILNHIDEFYMEQTAHIFLATLSANDTLPLLSYWFIEQEDDFAMKVEVQPLSMQKTNFRLKQMRKRLNACCKGLLEVQFNEAGDRDTASLASSVLFQWRVDFLHRTVRDFLMEQEMQDMLTSWAKPGFNADLMICEALLAQIKTSPQEAEYLRLNGPVEELESMFRCHINLIESADEQNKLKELALRGALDETMQVIRAAAGVSGET